MTIDEIKQALRECKRKCSKTNNCATCPFATAEHHKGCPVGGYETLPCVLDIYWFKGYPIAKANATDPLTLNDYPRMARRTAGNKRKSDKMEEALFGLAGEVGELCDHYKKYKHQGHDLDYNHMAEEAGDVLWYLAEIADALGTTLEDIARRNIAKLRNRYPDGFDPERSINREGEHEDHH